MRPGVEIDSATPNGTLTVAGDIDLAGFRYQSVNPNSQKTSVYGSGEPGDLVLRAGGDLDIVGSISDGFDARNLSTPPDDNGWAILAGTQAFATETLLPFTINAGTTFSNTSGALRFDIPIDGATIAANMIIPVQVTLSSDITVPAARR